MGKVTVLAAAAIGLAVAVAVYFTSRSPDHAPTPSQPPAHNAQQPEAAAPTAVPNPIQREATQSHGSSQAVGTMPADPRLAALMISSDNGLIEFVRSTDGKVIKEIDRDPNSLGYQKPLREYTYAGDKVIGLTAYQYFHDHVQTTKTVLSYKPDGSVDDYLESTSHEYEKK